MDLPLIDYFIYSSHNTYLTGNQMIGTSSIEMYNYCLKNGCRLVELDCWDGSSGPIVTHWHFPVSKLIFKEVLMNIKKYAFKKSEFPVILSIENHCNDENQMIMFNNLNEVFYEGEIFIIDKENPPLIYPSPNELKRKIIVKCRRKRFLQNVTNTKPEILMKCSPRSSLKMENNLVSNTENVKESVENLNNNNSVNNVQKVIQKNVDKNNLVKPNDVIQEIQENNSKENSDEDDVNEAKYFDITPQSSKSCKLKLSLEQFEKKDNFSHEFSMNTEEEKKVENLIFEDTKRNNEGVDVKDSNRNSLNKLLETTNELHFKENNYKVPEKDQIKDTTITESNVNQKNQFKIEYVEDTELKLKNLNIDLKEIESSNINYCHEDQNYNNKNKNFHSFVTDSERNSENDLDLGLNKNSSNKFSNDLIKKLKDKYSTKLSNNQPQRKRSLIIETGDNKSISDAITNLQELQAKKKLEKHYTIVSLSTLIGMIGVPFDNNDFINLKNLPWECVSLGEPEFIALYSSFENKLKLIKYCQKSFLKVYPNIFRTDSTNHNPIRSWICGAQISALNLQRTDDDYILINKIFFKINGGSRSGYILKPEFLRNPEISLKSLESRYIRPAFKIKFKILSGFHLHMCFPVNKKIKGIYVEVSLRGTEQDDDNPKLVTSQIVENFLHPVWKSNSVEFEIYEPELSFFVVKLLSKNGKNILARSVIPVKILNLGYRILDLYDMACTKFDQSFLIIKTNKIFV